MRLAAALKNVRKKFDQTQPILHFIVGPGSGAIVQSEENGAQWMQQICY